MYIFNYILHVHICHELLFVYFSYEELTNVNCQNNTCLEESVVKWKNISKLKMI